MSNNNNIQHSSDEAIRYLEETKEYVQLLKSNLFNKIMGEEQRKKNPFELHAVKNDYLAALES